MKETRSHKRYTRRFIARFGERDFSRSGFTKDISGGGSFIISSYRPPLDSYLHLQISVENQQSAYFEATVRHLKIIPPELRSMNQGGFGVRFLTPHEVLAHVLADAGKLLEVRYATAADLKLAHEREIQHGGVFVPAERKFERGSDVIVTMRLDFASIAFEFEASVVHVWQDSSFAARGIGVMFKDNKEVEGSLAPFLS